MQMVVFLLDGKKVTNGVPQGLILVLLLFLIYITDLPKITDNDAKVVLFTDNTNIIVINSNQGGLQTALNKTISDVISWFTVSFLLLNFNKTYYLEFRTKIALTLHWLLPALINLLLMFHIQSFWV